MDDERLAANTPPLHFQCRSLLRPIARQEWQRLQAGSAAAQRTAFGWASEARPDGSPAPRTLEQAEEAWGAVNKKFPPLPGFGGVEDMQKPSKKQPQADAGVRFFPVNRVPRSARLLHVSASEVEIVHDHYQELVRQGAFATRFDRSDIDLVARYLESHEGADEWEMILHGGINGASILLHEMTELKGFIQADIDPFKRRTEADYDRFHGLALIPEHRYLFDMAQRRGYNIKEIGSLVRWNGNTKAIVNKRNNKAQGQYDLEMANRHLTEKWVADDSDKPQVEAFFKSLEER